MRILIDNGSYAMRNMGDIGMLQIAARRLRELWPDAELSVVTHEPARVDRYIGEPSFEPTGRAGFRRARVLPLALRCSPERWRGKLVSLQRRLHRARPDVRWRRRGRRQLRRRKRALDVLDYLDRIRTADLVVASGGGYLSDEFGQADEVLDTFALAQAFGVPTALLSQGIGPIADERLRERMGAVLGRARLIGLREGGASRALLETMGVEEDRILYTGDDAIALAAGREPVEGADGIGVNVRLARYSGVGREQAGRLARCLRDLAAEHRAKLLAVPISYSDTSSDVASIEILLGSDAAEGDRWPREDTPEAAIRQVGRCRVVVTGSYHAGVFALAQGIPVVGLVGSRYYLDKFTGLAEQFGGGCEIVLLGDGDFSARTVAAVRQAWHRADALRPALREAAARQVGLGEQAYRKLRDLMCSRSAV